MTLDERVRSELSAMAEEVLPEPDPLGRLRARQRRSRRTRTIAACAAAVVALSAVMVTTGRGGGSAPDVAQRPDSRAEWARRLIESPARGVVAANVAFRTELVQRVAAATGQSDPRVLYLDDVGDARLGLLAFRGPDGNSTGSLWLMAPRGATAEKLTSSVAAPEKLFPDASYAMSDNEMDPFTRLQIYLSGSLMDTDLVTVGVAPAGCQVATADLPSVSDWKDEPTGAYVVRGPGDQRAEWWRVTCDGVVRFEEPAPVPSAPTVTDAELDAALSGARGTVDRTLARDVIRSSATTNGYRVIGLPVVVWGGDLPEPYGKATVVAAPMVGQGWLVDVSVAYGQPGTEGAQSHGTQFFTQSDPRDPAGVIVGSLAGDTTDVALVIVPDGAVSVRAIRAGKQIGEADVRGGGAVLHMPIKTDIKVQALDASGAVIGTGALAKPGGRRMIDNW